LINRLQRETAWGVYLFFVLSGFLITRILMRCREDITSRITTPGFSLRQFYVRRFLRIFPLYYLILFIGVALNVEGVREGFAWHAGYLTNLYFFHRDAFIGPTTPFWSLAVEEQFYIFWPFAILFLPVKKIAPFVVLMAIIGLVCKSTALLAQDGIYFILTPACVHYLAIGALVAVVENPLCGSAEARSRLVRIYLLLAVICASAMILARIIVPKHAGIQAIMLHAMAAVLFGWVVARSSEGFRGSLGSILRFPPAVYLGKISYGLYCYHSFIKWTLLWCVPYLARFIGEGHANFWMTNFGVRFLVTVGVSSASWFLFEKPLNDFKRFFPYSPRTQTPASEDRAVPVPLTEISASKTQTSGL
jgi:peptidoglycan/LPS O-acetylase OafA/YrhL